MLYDAVHDSLSLQFIHVILDYDSFFFFFQAEDGIRDAQESRGLGDVYKRQINAEYGESRPISNMSETFTSKLGQKWPRTAIEKADKASHARLRELTRLPENRRCAECNESPTCWASVTLGVFVCMRCSQIHRNMGAHISKVKSCMGTYLWAPDELEAMASMGNQWAAETYGGQEHVPVGGSHEEIEEYARQKYVHRRWAGQAGASRAKPTLRQCVGSTGELQVANAVVEPDVSAAVESDWDDWDTFEDPPNVMTEALFATEKAPSVDNKGKYTEDLESLFN
eukprot:TRINITY_DN18193_c0_g1_i2.p1 TRINITY_DN18193_c0_g1~~TRINITY_DN18193_c0_g1_i2.p1  ORF type:complete len:282 (-),score=54.09 TRINITY_DN18193_c0_g1_i2:287-1132(-)